MDLGFRIAGAPLFREARKDVGPISFFQERSVVAPRRALGKHIGGGVKPDRNREFIEQFPSPGIDEGASAGGNDANITPDKARNETSFPIAEVMFAIALEQLCGGRSRRFLNFYVAVYERQAKPLGQATPNGRLAGAHQPDKNDRPVKKVGQLFHFVEVSIWAGLYIVPQGRAKAFLPFPRRRGADMPRGLIILIIAIILIGAGMVLLSRGAEEVPVQNLEADVTANAAAQ